VLLPSGFDVHPGLVRQYEKRALGGIADYLAVYHHGIVGHQVGQDDLIDGFRAADRVLHPALQAVAGTADGVSVGRADDLHRGHLVHRQGACLVGVDG
jgi:hypothetical protein